MRLFNFAMTGSTQVEGFGSGYPVPDSSQGEIASGTTPGHMEKRPGSVFLAFGQNKGNDTTESPYGNVKFYNEQKVNTTSELAITQSYSGPITGSVISDFLFIVETV